MDTLITLTDPYVEIRKEINNLNFYISKKHESLIIKPIRNSKTNPKINRNDLCPCNSGKKYKHCCINQS